MWIVLGVIFGIIIWLFVGASVTPTGTLVPENPCAICQELRTWYNAQGFWTQLATAAWFVAQMTGCLFKGC
jgi:hypothetical protein